MFGMPAGSPLGRVVHELTQPHARTHGTLQGQEPPLLDLLRVAVRSDVGGAAGGGGERSKVPFDPTALQLLDDITAQVAQWGMPPLLPLPRQVQEYTLQVVHAGHTAPLAALLATCLQWRTAIYNLLEPPQRVPLRGVVCPYCSCDHLTKVDEHGEQTYTAALLVHLSETPVRGECLVCGETWLAGELLDLHAGKIRS